MMLTLLFVLSTFSVVAVVNAVIMFQSEKNEILRLHNEARRSVSNASNMIELVWETGLEEDAQGFADTCPSEHSPRSERPGQGETLAWGWPYRTVASVMKGLVDDERPYFNYSLKEWCRDGYSNCGHYTQVIWANTSRVACARRSGCTGMRNRSRSGDVYVCRYKVIGNVKWERPYLRGAKCSACPSEFGVCIDGLCTTSSGSTTPSRSSSTRSMLSATTSSGTSSGSATMSTQLSSSTPASTTTSISFTSNPTICESGRELAADTRANGLYNRKCVFPFRYKGVIYNGCTKEDRNNTWCALEVISGTDEYVIGRWGNCACVNYMCEEGRSVVADMRGDENYGYHCVFPFIYEGKQYTSCTNYGLTKPWCSLKTDSNGLSVTGQWGICACALND